MAVLSVPLSEVQVDVVASGGVDVLVPAPEGDEGAPFAPPLDGALEVLWTLSIAVSKHLPVSASHK